jgi:hypothetical protein
MILIANKIDLRDEGDHKPCISKAEGAAFARENNFISYVKTSVESGFNVGIIRSWLP